MVTRRGWGTDLNRGSIYDVDLPSGRRPAVVITRERAIPLLANVTVATITSRMRGVPTEVPVGPDEGLNIESVVNCDNLYTVPKALVGRYRGTLDPSALRRLGSALRIALDLD